MLARIYAAVLVGWIVAISLGISWGFANSINIEGLRKASNILFGGVGSIIGLLLLLFIFGLIVWGLKKMADSSIDNTWVGIVGAVIFAVAAFWIKLNFSGFDMKLAALIVALGGAAIETAIIDYFYTSSAKATLLRESINQPKKGGDVS